MTETTDPWAPDPIPAVPPHKPYATTPGQPWTLAPWKCGDDTSTREAVCPCCGEWEPSFAEFVRKTTAELGAAIQARHRPVRVRPHRRLADWTWDTLPPELVAIHDRPGGTSLIGLAKILNEYDRIREEPDPAAEYGGDLTAPLCCCNRGLMCGACGTGQRHRLRRAAKSGD